MKTTSIIVLMALLASCKLQSREKEEEKKAEGQATTKTDQLSNCYEYVTQSDTVVLRLLHVGENITGMLVYKFKEKDSNKGTILGSMQGDILLARYKFMSEGTQSERQVAFKKSGNTFTEGYGESVEVNGVTKFKNVDSLDFSSSIKLQEVPCP